jgi:hypothetical protein
MTNLPYAIYRTDNGAIVRAGTTQDLLLPLVGPGPGEAVFFGAATPEDRVDVATGHLIIGGNRTPAEPAGYSQIDGLWKPSLQGLKGAKKVAINTERERRIFASIQYAGRPYDTLMRSLNSMSQKLDELEYLQDGQEYPGLLEWRDANNAYVTFTSIGEMRAWLLGLRAAIARRRSEAYAWSWQRKDALEALSTVEQVVGFVP